MIKGRIKGCQSARRLPRRSDTIAGIMRPHTVMITDVLRYSENRYFAALITDNRYIIIITITFDPIFNTVHGGTAHTPAAARTSA